MKKALPLIVGIVALVLIAGGKAFSQSVVPGQSSGGASASGRRGLRNNNPGNIRKSGDQFQGEVASTDPSFKQFSTMIYGARAMLKILLNYGSMYGLNTISKIVTRWAPAADGNNPAAYADYVSKETGIGKEQPLSTGMLMWVANAMTYVENGKSEAIAAGFGPGNTIWSEAMKLI